MASAQMQVNVVATGALDPAQCRQSIPARSGRTSGIAGRRALHSTSSSFSRRQCRLQIVRAIAAPPAPSAKASEPAAFKAWENITSTIEKRTDIKTIMLLGAGPIVIGQVPLRIRP